MKAPDGAGNNKAAGTFVDSRLTSCAGGCICFGHCAGEFFVLGVPGGDGRGGMHAILAVQSISQHVNYIHMK